MEMDDGGEGAKVSDFRQLNEPKFSLSPKNTNEWMAKPVEVPVKVSQAYRLPCELSPTPNKKSLLNSPLGRGGRRSRTGWLLVETVEFQLPAPQLRPKNRPTRRHDPDDPNPRPQDRPHDRR